MGDAWCAPTPRERGSTTPYCYRNHSSAAQPRECVMCASMRIVIISVCFEAARPLRHGCTYTGHECRFIERASPGEAHHHAHRLLHQQPRQAGAPSARMHRGTSHACTPQRQLPHTHGAQLMSNTSCCGPRRRPGSAPCQRRTDIHVIKWKPIATRANALHLRVVTPPSRPPSPPPFRERTVPRAPSQAQRYGALAAVGIAAPPRATEVGDPTSQSGDATSSEVTSPPCCHRHRHRLSPPPPPHVRPS